MCSYEQSAACGRTATDLVACAGTPPRRQLATFAGNGAILMIVFADGPAVRIASGVAVVPGIDTLSFAFLITVVLIVVAGFGTFDIGRYFTRKLAAGERSQNKEGKFHRIFPSGLFAG